MKTCPFCGAYGVSTVSERYEAYVRCNTCEARGPIAVSRHAACDHAEEAWDMRTITPSVITDPEAKS